MAEQKKKAKYFCEGCGSEVASNAKFCPKCGKFFAAVRCPNCGHIGTVRDFLHGCPSCHYAMSHEAIYGEPESKTLDGRKHKLSKKSKKMIKVAFRKHENAGFGDDVPGWLFIASIATLIGICIVFFKRCTY